MGKKWFTYQKQTNKETVLILVASTILGYGLGTGIFGAIIFSIIFVVLLNWEKSGNEVLENGRKKMVHKTTTRST